MSPLRGWLDRISRCFFHRKIRSPGRDTISKGLLYPIESDTPNPKLLWPSCGTVQPNLFYATMPILVPAKMKQH
jgi:hypothetical protein